MEKERKDGSKEEKGMKNKWREREINSTNRRKGKIEEDIKRNGNTEGKGKKIPVSNQSPNMRCVVQSAMLGLLPVCS